MGRIHIWFCEVFCLVINNEIGVEGHEVHAQHQLIIKIMLLIPFIENLPISQSEPVVAHLG